MGELSLIDKSKFGWTETERYTILDLGTMPNAIVIKKEEGGSRYCISLRSYFSFPDNYYNMRFGTKKETIEFACKYILEWISQMNHQLKNHNIV